MSFRLLHVIEFTEQGEMAREQVWLDLAADPPAARAGLRWKRRRSPRGRDNQRQRTRKDLLRAAARLLESGRAPTMDEVAEEAMVSRATAYRYFPTIEALLVEAPMDGEVASLKRMFAGDPSADPAERLDRAETAMHEHLSQRGEAAPDARALTLQALGAAARGGRATATPTTPLRQNRRGALIEAALAPARTASTTRLRGSLAALALVFGTESMVVFRDVLPLPPDRAREVKSWVIRALVAAALERSGQLTRRGRQRRPRMPPE